MEPKQFREFLVALRDEVPCRLIGSFACGDEDTRSGYLSDIDFVCQGKQEDDFGKVIDHPMRRAIQIFERFGVPWESVIVGSIGSPRDTTTLPRPVEVMEDCWIPTTKDDQSMLTEPVHGPSSVAEPNSRPPQSRLELIIYGEVAHVGRTGSVTFNWSSFVVEG